ncbi:MAG: class I SAM-dependent methyltransferase [Chloroflexota bacterium]
MTSNYTDQIKRQTRDAYNWLAASYAQNWGNHIDQTLTEPFLKLLPPQAIILDVGCGPGQYTKYFARRNCKTVGIDLSANMLGQARPIFRNGLFSRMDMWNMGFPTGLFDALWVCASFPHVPENEAVRVLTEFKRIIKNQGVLFLGIILGDAPVRIESRQEMGNYDREGRFFQWYRELPQFEPYLIGAGFEIVETRSRTIHSNVVENARCKTNTWLNIYCRAT